MPVRFTIFTDNYYFSAPFKNFKLDKKCLKIALLYIQDWSLQNGMKFSETKTTTIHLSYSQSSNSVQSQTSNFNLPPKTHIDSLYNKFKVFLFKKNEFVEACDHKSLSYTYYSLIRSKCNYMASIYTNHKLNIYIDVMVKVGSMLNMLLLL